LENFDELRDLAADVVAAYDVVLGIFPSGEGMGLHVVKGSSLLDRLATLQSNALYSRTAIAVHSREQAVELQALVA